MTAMTRRALKLAVIAVVVAAGALALARLPIADRILAAVAWIRDAGWIGVAVFTALYVGAAVALLPGSVLTLGAGFAYGPVWGTLLVSPVSVLASVAAFALARTVLRPWVTRRFGTGERFAAIDRAIGQQGGRIVFLLRLSPVVPYSAFNYVCGITRIDARRFALASWLGMLPGTVLYTYLGSLAKSTAELAAGGGGASTPGQRALYWGGLAATVVAAVVVTRVARAALRRSLPAQ